MTGAVPALLGRVPLDDALEMGADGGAVVERAAGVAEDGDLVHAVPNDPPLTAGNLGFVEAIGAEKVFYIVDGDVDVFPCELLQRFDRERNTSRVVDLLPGILASHDEIGEEDPGDGTVGHSLSRVAGGHVDVLGAVGVAADEGDVVVRLEDLPGPAVDHLAGDGPPLTQPLL